LEGEKKDDWNESAFLRHTLTPVSAAAAFKHLEGFNNIAGIGQIHWKMLRVEL